MTAFARSFAAVLWVTAIVAACASSYLDQTAALVIMVRVYAYAAGGLGGLLIILSLPRMAMPLPMPANGRASPKVGRRALPPKAAVPMVRLKPKAAAIAVAPADDPDALRARTRRLFGTAA